MAPDFEVAIYIVGELLPRQYIGRVRLIFRCRWVVVQDQVPIWYGCGVPKSIHKPVSITLAYLVRHCSELRCVPAVTKHYTLVRIK